jgi:hypothetical protein
MCTLVFSLQGQQFNGLLPNDPHMEVKGDSTLMPGFESLSTIKTHTFNEFFL